MRMIQAGNRARVALKSLAQVRAAGKMIRQNFDSDGAVEARIASAVDLAHPARADRREDFVRAQALTGLNSHGTPLRWNSQSITRSLRTRLNSCAAEACQFGRLDRESWSGHDLEVY